jgi:hypothetical protein
MFDKGYHKLLKAKQQGQLCCQPDKVDLLSNWEAVLCTACVAVTQSGNEQGVKQGKLSWFVKNGMKHNLMDIDLMCDMWEAWTL